MKLVRIAMLWQIAYALVHAWWASSGAPRFQHGRESYYPGGWVPVVLGVLAALACLGAATRRSVAAAPAAVAGAALCLYSFLFPVYVVSLLFEGVRPGGIASLLATGSGAAGGVLCLIVAARLRGSGGPPVSRGERAPGWAFAGAYVAVLGFAARISVWLADTIAGRWPSPAGPPLTSMVVFLVLMCLAGTLLPLALAHRWGRLWPAWVVPLRGRPVPRWLVLGTGLFMGASLTAYFGIAGMTAWIRGDFGGPFLPLLLEMGGYTLWGAGLLVAAASYATMTRPA